MVREQNLAGDLSCILLPPPTSKSAQETGADSILIVHFLPHFWFSVQVWGVFVCVESP